MTVYEPWIWCECMYQLWLYTSIEIGVNVCISWLYMSIEFGLSVCISYDCIWALNLVWVCVSVMTVYEPWNGFECMYQLWLYMSIEMGLSVCISYDCIWALKWVWVYVSVMTVYEPWIWFECMYQLWLYISIKFGTLMKGYRCGLKFGVFMTNHTTYFLIQLYSKLV